ncbi:hypothetical protein DW322_21170 [Rhodococcus rhodnii]|uniref:Uncharacterized protein n=1 Tax=Rhodococcus rhodnii TaxID=38312 RepID=A0A6P2CKT4_9NOCA|nr:hypothetical protein DW322_21170 [Rhodococcus rhodnii]
MDGPDVDDDPKLDELFVHALTMAEAARRGDGTAWMQARAATRRCDDLAYLTSMLLGQLVENDAVRRGVHPADEWTRLRRAGIENFG